MNKQTLRQTLRQQRKTITPEAAWHAGQAFCHHIQTLFAQYCPQQIACYLAQDGEMDLSLTIQWLRQQGAMCYLPILHPARKGYLWFAPYDPESEMTQNHYGIDEPQYDIRSVRAPWEMDWVLMPLVGFDRQGNRLGMGGGFYDRSFAAHRPTMIGCAYALQCVPSIPTDPWDKGMDIIVTEQEIICG